MRKTAILLFAACLLLSCSVAGLAVGSTKTAQAGSAKITAEVPSTHKLTVESGDATVSYNGETESPFDVPRLEEFTLTVSVEDGYVITGIYLDGEDVTDSLVGDELTLDGIHAASVLTITTAEVAGGGTFSGVLYDLPDQELPDESLLYKIAVEVSGLTEVPEALRSIESLNTVEKISEVLKSILITQCGYPEANVVIYEVTLVISEDGGETWEAATEENFPAAGLSVVLPYPEGTAKDTQDFAATHMFTSTAFGNTPGDTENPEVTKTDEGLLMTLHGLSPVAIAWTDIDTGTEGEESTTASGGTASTGTSETETETSETSETETAVATGTDGDSEESETTGKASISETIKGVITGDDSHLFVWLLLLMISGSALIAAARSAWKNREE